MKKQRIITDFMSLKYRKMRSEREPEMRFWMALYGKDIDLAGIEVLLRIQLDYNRIDVPDDLPDDPEGPIFYEEITWLLNLAEKNEKELNKLGVDLSDSQINS